MRAHSSAVERPAHNRLVPGSNPGGPTKPAAYWRRQYRNAVAAAYLGSTVAAKKPANPEGRVPKAAAASLSVWTFGIQKERKA